MMRRPMVAFFIQLLLPIRSRCSGRARFEAENPPAPTAHSVTPQVSDALETVEHRSLVVGMAVSTVSIAPGRDHHRPAGDRDPLAPTRFPRLLALEIPPRRRPSTD